MKKLRKIQRKSAALGTSAAAEYVGLSAQSLCLYRSKGTGPKFKRAGSKILYLRKDLDEWLDSLPTG